MLTGIPNVVTSQKTSNHHQHRCRNPKPLYGFYPNLQCLKHNVTRRSSAGWSTSCINPFLNLYVELITASNIINIIYVRSTNTTRRPARSGPSHILCKMKLTVYIRSPVSVCTREYSLNPNSNKLEADRPQRDRPATCHRPAVFFRYLRLVALSSPQSKIWSPFFNKNSIFQFLLLLIPHNFVSLKLRNLWEGLYLRQRHRYSFTAFLPTVP